MAKVLIMVVLLHLGITASNTP